MKELFSWLKILMQPTLTRRFLYGYFYGFLRENLSLKQNYVLLESHHGSDFGGSPYYIAAHLARTPKYQNLKIIMVGPSRRSSWLKRHLNKRIVTIRPRSLRYVYYLAVSQWLISDVTFPLYFNRRQCQYYLNTWHGTPLKVLGKYIPDGTKDQFLNTQRNFFHASSILVPNAHTEQVLKNSYCLGLVNESVYIRAGYPRNDPLVLAQSDPLDRKVLNIAFMPTWRGKMASRNVSSKKQLIVLLDVLNELENNLPPSCIVWVKMHPLIKGRANLDTYQNIKSFPEDLETYEHLARCDILITDYSSVFFDYAATKRNIIRYITDEQEYITERGFCIEPQELPFPCAYNTAELIALIEENIMLPGGCIDNRYFNFNEEFNPHDKGVSSSDLCDVFFGKSTHTFYPREKSKEYVAIYLVDAHKNLEAYRGLLKSLDDSKFIFVLLIELEQITEEWEEILKELPSSMLFVAMGFHAYISPSEFFGLTVKAIMNREINAKGNAWSKLARREFNRLFGNIELDTLILIATSTCRSSIIESGYCWKNIHNIGSFQPGVKLNLTCIQNYLKKQFAD